VLAAVPFAVHGADAAQALQLDERTCGELRRQAPSHATKFTLSRRGCVDGAASDVAAGGEAPSRGRQAQQLYLYDNAGGLAPPALTTPSAPPSPSLGAPTGWRAPAASRRKAPPAAAVTPVKTISHSAPARALALAPLMDATAREHDIDPLLLHAIAHVESRHNAQAISPAGARGVMQVMPPTARRFGVDGAHRLHHAPTNVEVGAVYLKTLQRRFGNNLPLVLAAYNAGEGAVERYGRRIPPYPETQAYVKGVLAEYQRLRTAATTTTKGPTL
jgi:soluble lytic murein transglycosylase-like protein